MSAANDNDATTAEPLGVSPTSIQRDVTHVMGAPLPIARALLANLLAEHRFGCTAIDCETCSALDCPLYSTTHHGDYCSECAPLERWRAMADAGTPLEL